MTRPSPGERFRLNQVTVPTTDVLRAVEFYRTLGLVPIVESGHYARFVVPGNEATFSVHAVEHLQASSTVVYFECDDLDATVDRLAASGVVFDEPPTDRRWRWREARLTDPDGNRLCLYRAGDDRLNPPWRVGASRDRHVLTPERFRHWLDRLETARGAQDATATLFAPGVAPSPVSGTPGSRPCRFVVVHVHGDVGLARRRSADDEHEDGIVEVAFDPDGRAVRWRSWSLDRD